MLHTNTHTYKHTHHGVVSVFPFEIQGQADACDWCDLLVKVPSCILRSEKGRLSNVWRSVRLFDGGRIIGRAKK